MTKLLDIAVEQAKGLPAELQDEMAELVFKFISLRTPIPQLTSEEEASFSRSLDQAARREFASDDDVQSVFSKYAQ